MDTYPAIVSFFVSPYFITSSFIIFVGIVRCCQGTGLDAALTAEDYQVTVDVWPCPVVLLTSNLLSCRLDASVNIAVHRAAVKVMPLHQQLPLIICSFLFCLPF